MPHHTKAHDTSPVLPSKPAFAGAPHVFLPPLGYKRCTACGERRRIKGGRQKDGRFVCAHCVDSANAAGAGRP